MRMTSSPNSRSFWSRIAWNGRGARVALRSTAMLQHDPADGAPLFLHNNMHKWTLDVPPEWARYERRWVVATPEGWNATLAGGEAGALEPVQRRLYDVLARDRPLAAARFRGERAASPRGAQGFDVERVAWEALRALQCQPWLPAYAELRRRRFGEIEPAGFSGKVPKYKGIALEEHMSGRYVKRGVGARSRLREQR